MIGGLSVINLHAALLFGPWLDRFPGPVSAGSVLRVGVSVLPVFAFLLVLVFLDSY